VKEYTSDHIRNLCLIGHGGAGKTTFSEALLHSANATTRLGKVEEGNTLSDFHPDEIERQISINTSMLFCEWNGYKINILDTPGYTDFTGEVKAALRVADTAIVILKGVEGVEVGTEIVWRYTADLGTPVLLAVNKMDHENTEFDKVVEQIKERFSHDACILQFPVGHAMNFNAIIDVLRMKMLTFSRTPKGTFTEAEIPEEHLAKARALHEELIEKIAESDENLMTKFFERGTLDDDELRRGIRTALLQRKVFPIFALSGAENIGPAALLDVIVNYCPSPVDRGPVTATASGSGEPVTVKGDPTAPTALFVFKTMSEPHVGELSFFRLYSGTLSPGLDLVNQSNGKAERIGQIFVMNGKERKDISKIFPGDLGAAVKLKDTHTNNTLCSKSNPIIFKPIEFPEPVISSAVVAKAKGDEDKIANGFHYLHEEDPTLLITSDPALNQTLISGQGELHLQIVVKRLKEKFGVEVEMIEPKIPYRETIKGTAPEVDYKHKKQTGGRGQYGHVTIKIEPLPRGSGFEFVDAIVGGVVPGRFIPAVEKGIIEALQNGVIAGCQVVDVRVSLFYGSYHTVDSDEHSFKIAGRMAFKKGFKDAKPILLEPIYELEVTVPEEYMGDVMGDISSRRGKILGMEAEGPFQKIKALVPLKELYRYSTVLRSMTQGRGIHRQKFDHYEEVPRDVMEKIIAAAAKEEVEEE
jgi:elongation factor G